MKRTKEPWKCGPPGSVSSALAGGFVAGLVAGVVLVLTRLVIDLGVVAFLLRLLPWHAAVRDIVHREFWASLKRAALPLVGDRVYNPGFDAPVVWLAVVVLLVLSICVGVAFGLVARGRSRMATCMIAIPFGIGAWLIESPSRRPVARDRHRGHSVSVSRSRAPSSGSRAACPDDPRRPARDHRAPRGRSTTNDVPSASVEVTAIVPPCASAICWVMKRPSPRPLEPPRRGCPSPEP